MTDKLEPNIEEFTRFRVTYEPNTEGGINIILWNHELDAKGIRIGALESCGISDRAIRIHRWKVSHPATKKCYGVLKYGTAHFMIYEPDGTFGCYHLA